MNYELWIMGYGLVRIFYLQYFHILILIPCLPAEVPGSRDEGGFLAPSSKCRVASG